MIINIKIYRNLQRLNDTNIQFNTQSFTFPPDVGYALDARYYLMETHYSDMEPPKDLEGLHATPAADNSGLKLYYTSALRKHDAGVLSIGKLSLYQQNTLQLVCFLRPHFVLCGSYFFSGSCVFFSLFVFIILGFYFKSFAMIKLLLLVLKRFIFGDIDFFPHLFLKITFDRTSNFDYHGFFCLFSKQKSSIIYFQSRKFFTNPIFSDI